MRFHVGPIPEEPVPDSSWLPIREPGPWLLQAIALPLGLGVAIFTLMCWQWLGLPLEIHFRAAEALLFLAGLALSFPLLFIAHELLHAVVHPHFGTTPKSLIGAWPSRMILYAHYHGAMSRNRFLAVFAMPFLGITVLPLVIAASGLLPPSACTVAAWFSSWNAFFACGDYCGIALIFLQIPRAALVQNFGWCSYWKPVGT